MNLARLYPQAATGIRGGQGRIALLGAVAAAMLGSGEANAASITYNVDDIIGGGSVVGSVTTDGVVGAVSASDILNWNLLLTGVGSGPPTFTLTGGNSSVYIGGSDLTATPTQLNFNYSGTDNGGVVFQTIHYSGLNYWCNATSAGGCYQGQTVSPQFIFDGTAQHVATQGEKTIGLATDVTSVPGFGLTTDPSYPLITSVSLEPASAAYPGGLYHYSYEVTYDATQQRLILPLLSAGAVQNVSGCAIADTAGFAAGETLQSLFGSEYSSAIACSLPAPPVVGGVPSLGVFDFSFDSAYTPTNALIGLVDASGVVTLVDPPVPSGGALAGSVPEPATWAMMLLGFAGLGLTGYRNSRKHAARAA